VGHQSFYVALSRARQDVRIFTNDIGSLPKALAKSIEQSSALEIVRPRAHQIEIPGLTFE
jgi:hypothetical protein